MCHGSSWYAASPAAATATSAMPIESGHLEPNMRPRIPASGPAKSIVTEAGRR